MKSPAFRAIGSTAPRFVANFDSASSMIRTLGAYLKGGPAPGVGGMAPPSSRLARAVNAIPWPVKDKLYAVSGAMEAIPSSSLTDVDAEELKTWVTGSYPERQYPIAFVGSSSGALVHLAAALGVPWLPQTFLVPVRRPAMNPDDPIPDMEWGRENARALLDNNPDWQLHHMNDPNQDRLMIQYMTYFRIKALRLGEAYETFLRQTLEPGGTIFTVECLRRWPVSTIGDRHYFQFGATICRKRSGASSRPCLRTSSASPSATGSRSGASSSMSRST